MINFSNKHVLAYVDEKSHIIGEIFADTVSELPSPDGIEGYELVQGSVAYVIKSGELYILSSDGTWYSSDGESAIVESDNIQTENL